MFVDVTLSTQNDDVSREFGAEPVITQVMQFRSGCINAEFAETAELFEYLLTKIAPISTR